MPLQRLIGSLLAGSLALLPSAGSAQAAGSPVVVTVDLQHSSQPFRPTWSWFGYDEANYTTMHDGRALLRELHDLSPVPVTIRVHHLLTSGDGTAELKWSSTGVYREDAAGHPVYDFHLLDGIFDEFKAAGVRPMVELGFMPQELAARLPGQAPQPYQVHYPQSTIAGASNNPPVDYAKWRDLVRAVTAHLVARYGESTVRTWYFEVWNEPDIPYWHGSMEDYFKLYDYSVAGVRSALPGALVGGPASTGPGNAHAAAFLAGFLDHVRSGHNAAGAGPIPLDFLSFHAKGQPNLSDGHVKMGLAKELVDVNNGFTLIARYPEFRHLPIILSEADPEGCAACSSKVNPANNYRNGTLYPAYTAAAYKGILDLNEQHGTNLLAMLNWSFEFEGKDYFEGFRSLSTNGIDKPILNLFRMLALMHGQRAAVTSTGSIALPALLETGVPQQPDIDALASSDAHAAAVLLWDYHDNADPAPDTAVRTVITGLPKGVNRVLLTPYRIDSTHSNAYTLWQHMGSPQQPTPEQLTELKAHDGLELLHSPVWLDVIEGRVTLPLDLPRQSVTLLGLTWP